MSEEMKKVVKVGDLITHPQKFEISAGELLRKLGIVYDGKLSALTIHSQGYCDGKDEKTIYEVDVKSITEDKMAQIDYTKPVEEVKPPA